MSATLFFIFEPPIEHRIQSDHDVLLKLLHGDYCGCLMPEELQALRSFAVQLSDQAVCVEPVAPVFPVEGFVRLLARIRSRLESLDAAQKTEAVVKALAQTQSGFAKIKTPAQLFCIGLV